MSRVLSAVLMIVFLSTFSHLPTAASQEVDAGPQVVVGPTFVDGQDPKPADKKWAPVEILSDEFNGDEIDDKKWQTEPVGNGWRWVGRAPALFTSDTVSVANGKMNVTVSPLPEPVKIKKSEFNYQGAIVRSRNPGQVGMYFEAKMKANQTAMSSTFWLMTKPGKGMRQELDIQECVGALTDQTAKWAKGWDQLFHSNLILIETGKPGKVQKQDSIKLPTKCYERFYVYAAWWKSTEEVQFFLDGKYAYSLKPSVTWDMPKFLQMAIEKYDWNPLPEDGGLIRTGTWEQRTTQYDWIRVWKLEP